MGQEPIVAFPPNRDLLNMQRNLVLSTLKICFDRFYIELNYPQDPARIGVQDLQKVSQTLPATLSIDLLSFPQIKRNIKRVQPEYSLNPLPKIISLKWKGILGNF
jgi:hypothetical protein